MNPNQGRGRKEKGKKRMPQTNHIYPRKRYRGEKMWETLNNQNTPIFFEKRKGKGGKERKKNNPFFSTAIGVR